MVKAVVVGLVIAILAIVACQAVTTLTYRHVQELALRNAGAAEIPLSTSERFFVRFSEFWARYFVFLSFLIVPTSILGALLVWRIRSRTVVDVT